MNSILDIIKPIELRVGASHNTAVTGRGCILNVCSYLAGDAHITDAPPSVDVHVRSLAAMINDFSSETTRQLLIPLIPRLLNSAASSDEVKHSRYLRLVEFRADFEKDFRRIWEKVGSLYGILSYGIYLRFKLLQMTGPDYEARSEQDKCKAMAILFAYGLQWLQVAALDAYPAKGTSSLPKYMGEEQNFLLFKAKVCLEEMLSNEPLEETEILQLRAATLMDTIKNYVPIKVRSAGLIDVVC